MLKAYTDKDSADFYCVAYCDCGHGKCQRRRTFLPTKRPRGPKARGRPLGYLCAWLAAGRRACVTDRATHKRVKLVRRDRTDARRDFGALEEADVWAAYEREQRGDEETEPFREP